MSTYMHMGAARTLAGLKQQGLTLVELMVAITLSFVVVLASTGLFVSSKASYVTQDSGSILNDTGRYALENIARSVRQAGYENWFRTSEDSPIVLQAAMTANLSGLDNRSLANDQTAGIGSTTMAVNSSDVLAVRFFGSGPAGHPDGSMVDCAGFPIAEPSSQNTAEQDRGWSIYYVAVASDGVPELLCRRMASGGGSWSAHAVARGVESFQVLYGVDTNGDRIPNRYMTASAVDALDDGLTLVGATVEEKLKDKNKKTHWKKISSIKVALLISGAGSSRADTPATTYHLFGQDYTNSQDPGTHVAESSLTPANRLRKVFTSTIQFRNPIEGDNK